MWMFLIYKKCLVLAYFVFTRSYVNPSFLSCYFHINPFRKSKKMLILNGVAISSLLKQLVFSRTEYNSICFPRYFSKCIPPNLQQSARIWGICYFDPDRWPRWEAWICSGPVLVPLPTRFLTCVLIKNLQARQLRDSNPCTVWSELKMESTVAIQARGTVWLNDRGSNREVERIGGWDEETERKRHNE